MAALTHLRTRLMDTPSLLTIGLGAVLLGWQTGAGTLPLWGQLIVFGGLLFGIGIPHGALDHLIGQETARRQGGRYSLPRFLVNYLLTMVAYGLAWWLFPATSLAFFLLISAWHFGETDLDNRPLTPLWSLTRLAAGGLLLAFLLLTHAEEVSPVLTRLTGNHPLTMRIWAGLLARTGAVLAGGTVAVVGLGMLAYRNRPAPLNWERLLRLGTLLALIWKLPLLLAFGLYFGGWHALSSFQSIYTYLRAGSGGPHLSAGQVWRRSLPFTGLALVGLVGMGLWWYQYARTWDPLPLLFMFLSLITLPHLNVMHRVNNAA